MYIKHILEGSYFARHQYRNLAYYTGIYSSRFHCNKSSQFTCSHSRSQSTRTLLASITYSMINLGFMSWAVVLLNRGFFPINSIGYFLALFSILVISPAILASVFYYIQKTSWSHRLIGSPNPTAWDHFFGKQRYTWILFHLKNGAKLGGYYGQDSFASAYPHERELYVKEVWQIDDQCRFIQKVEQTDGMIIRYDDCSLIEFFSAKENSNA